MSRVVIFGNPAQPYAAELARLCEVCAERYHRAGVLVLHRDRAGQLIPGLRYSEEAAARAELTAAGLPPAPAHIEVRHDAACCAAMLASRRCLCAQPTVILVERTDGR